MVNKLVRDGPPPVSTSSAFEERFEALERRLGAIVDLLTSREMTVRFQGTTNTDSSGNGLILVDTVNDGYEYSLHRLIVDDGTGTFAAPTTGGSIEILVNRQRVDGFNLGTVGLPIIFTASSSAGIFLRGGDELAINLVGVGAHSKRVFCLAQCKQRRIPLGE
jgi:hypothetical protein